MTDDEKLQFLVEHIIVQNERIQEALHSSLPHDLAETLQLITQRQVEWIQAVREIDIRLCALEALSCHRQYIGATRN